MSESDRNEYYALLGVSPDATPGQVEVAYRAALKATEGLGMDFSRKAVEQAFAILGDPTLRAAYDSGSAASHRPQVRHCEDDYIPSDSLPRSEVNHPRDPKGYYKLLRVPVDASKEEIVAAYFNHHIAKAGGIAGVDTRPLDAFSVAYNVLSDPILRTAYDPSWRNPTSSLFGPAPVTSGGRGFSKDKLRLDDPSPAMLRRGMNSPFGCLSVIVFIVGLVLFYR